MQWHDIASVDSARLDELAATYGLHSLHVEDCRNRGQRTKADDGETYIFIILVLPIAKEQALFATVTLALFVGPDFVIGVHDTPIPLLEGLGKQSAGLRPDQVLYRILDGVVESWLPIVERMEESVELLQDRVTGWPGPDVLERIAGTRNSIMQLRRVIGGAHHAVFRLRHASNPIITADLAPFLRDVHDDLTIHLETIAGERDRLTGVLDIYLSSVTNRTAEATRTLTLLGTIALPTLVITSFFGMAINYPSWTKSPSLFGLLIITTVITTGLLLRYLKRRDYLPGGTTARGVFRESSQTDSTHDRAAEGPGGAGALTTNPLGIIRGQSR
jgi:magnesium transporter